MPAPLTWIARRYLREGEEAGQVAAEISAVSAGLLARRELS